MGIAGAFRRVAQYGQGWIPFPAPALLARTTKTPVLETRADLARYLDELWALLEAAGRERSEIDVHFQNDQGGTPGEADFDANAWHEGIHALEKLGVTWCGVGVPAAGVERSIAALEQFGADVIAPLRGRAG